MAVDTAYEDCEDAPNHVRVELVLKRYVDINPSREVRCFVRDNVLLGTQNNRPDRLD